ncbi:MAG: hypothetical protein WC222_00975 [Parachlamydiales bacterium]|jgi:hypothetical protein
MKNIIPFSPFYILLCSPSLIAKSDEINSVNYPVQRLNANDLVQIINVQTTVNLTPKPPAGSGASPIALEMTLLYPAG